MVSSEVHIKVSRVLNQYLYECFCDVVTFTLKYRNMGNIIENEWD